MAQLYGICDSLKYRSGEPIRVLKSIAPYYTNSLDFGEEFFSVAVWLLLIVGDQVLPSRFPPEENWQRSIIG